MIIAKKIIKILNVESSHALYCKEGNWFHLLKSFPAILIDPNGYISFRTKSDYENSTYLQVKDHIHVPKGISSIPGYIKFTKEEKESIIKIL